MNSLNLLPVVLLLATVATIVTPLSLALEPEHIPTVGEPTDEDFEPEDIFASPPPGEERRKRRDTVNIKPLL